MWMSVCEVRRGYVPWIRMTMVLGLLCVAVTAAAGVAPTQAQDLAPAVAQANHGDLRIAAFDKTAPAPPKSEPAAEPVSEPAPLLVIFCGVCGMSGLIGRRRRDRFHTRLIPFDKHTG